MKKYFRDSTKQSRWVTKKDDIFTTKEPFDTCGNSYKKFVGNFTVHFTPILLNQ